MAFVIDFKKVNRMLSERNRKSCEKFEHAIEEWIERQNYGRSNKK